MAKSFHHFYNADTMAKFAISLSGGSVSCLADFVEQANHFVKAFIPLLGHLPRHFSAEVRVGIVEKLSCRRRISPKSGKCQLGDNPETALSQKILCIEIITLRLSLRLGDLLASSRFAGGHVYVNGLLVGVC